MKNLHSRQIGNLGLNWPKINASLCLMMQPFFKKYCLIMGHNWKAKATLIDFFKKSPFVVNRQFELRWPKIMQPYLSWFALRIGTQKKCQSLFIKNLHFRQIGNLGLNWPKITATLCLMMQPFFKKILSYNGPQWEGKSNINWFSRKNPLLW